ncbi:chorismate mutase / prephenate dehydratase [Sporobacter termitidis DSM 10068]|uniref:Bifunctional chorismate mutase/prephenate dehydratase n=1 Tax=Sporobacter termitidis DSM 10068 TaxID=1123282 RepID=A0A1M5X1P0_9FIRM|nr:bifunctional chorismate mutase/prephenate dehydratase [Sporobacter termitidis]SHH93805.1 chorismate mutase / prephenate dehydratase [Sporobacter termitidis DSM 10068]
MDIKELRDRIDEADAALLDAFCRRMDVSAQLAEYKKDNALPIYDPARERQKLGEVALGTPEPLRTHAMALYSLLFDLSRSYQEKILCPDAPLVRQITGAIDGTPKLFPQTPVVACQGVEGAYSQLACEKLFPVPNIMYCTTFESVFSAIDSGLCRYGVLPLENSTAGSINKIYDLMMKYRFYIVRSARLKVDHNLLAKKGTSVKDIKEIISHEQAINQCGAFLKSLSGVRITAAENTALAAQTVAESGRSDIAALSSRYCADLYGLECLAESVQDQGNNYTRFITISKVLEIYPGADKTSIMMAVPHKPGSLYRILSRFYALGINLIKLESRPIPDRDFEFMFYFDLDTPVYSPQFAELMSALAAVCEEFRYLGSYSEIV